MSKKSFPDDFLWGAATAAYQIEGGACEGGRGESIWDRYCAIPGNILDGSDGQTACDHYHRFREDVALMKNMGIRAYRFSISWPRVFPLGDGEVNEEGLGFYERLTDELLGAGIQPYATLYHWDLPQALQDCGGWANARTAALFARYAQTVFHRLDGKVAGWFTLNEPYCAAFLGNYEGRQAPGLRDFSTALRVAYYQYVGHAEAVRCFRNDGISGEIGIALNLMGRLPLTDCAEDVRAAVRADGYLNRWFLEPLFHGCYPKDMLGEYSRRGVVLPPISAAEMALMAQPLDFIGLNYYNDFFVRHESSRWPLQFVIENPPNLPLTDRGWPVTPDGFERMLLRLKREYGAKKILVTENGASYPDVVGVNGEVADGAREDYLRRHLLALHAAIEKGAPVKGYFAWSLMDNFEWSFGYTGRFGLVYVDYPTQRRIVKNSGRWYASVIAENAIHF